MKRLLAMIMVVVVFALSIPSGKVQASKLKPQLNKKFVSLEVGDSIKLRVIKNTKKVKWKSNKPKIASVSKKGKVTGKSEGIATITAKVGKKKYKCTVNVCEGFGSVSISYDYSSLTTSILVPKNTSARYIDNEHAWLNKEHLTGMLFTTGSTIEKNIPAGEYLFIAAIYDGPLVSIDTSANLNKLVKDYGLSKYISDFVLNKITDIGYNNGYIIKEIVVNPDECTVIEY